MLGNIARRREHPIIKVGRGIAAIGGAAAGYVLARRAIRSFTDKEEASEIAKGVPPQIAHQVAANEAIELAESAQRSRATQPHTQEYPHQIQSSVASYVPKRSHPSPWPRPVARETIKRVIPKIFMQVAHNAPHSVYGYTTGDTYLVPFHVPSQHPLVVGGRRYY